MAAAVAFAGGMFSYGSAAAGGLFSAAASFGAAGAFYAGATTGGCAFGGIQSDCAGSTQHNAALPKPSATTAGNFKPLQSSAV